MFFMNINISNIIYVVIQNPSTTASLVRDHSSEKPLAPAPYFKVDVDMIK